jgi:citrate lyase synthetase
MRKEEKMNRSLRKVEKKLETALTPVKPDSGFVSELRLQIDQARERRVKAKKVKKGILVAGGIVGVVVMVITIIRSLTSWDELLQSISGLFSKKEHKQQTASA